MAVHRLSSVVYGLLHKLISVGRIKFVQLSQQTRPREFGALTHSHHAKLHRDSIQNRIRNMEQLATA